MDKMNALASTQAIEYEQATSNRRLAARFIDLVLAWFTLLPFSGGVLGVAAAAFPGTHISDKAAGWLLLASWIVLVIAYDTLMHRLFGKTVGKILLHTRVVDVEGNRLGWGRCLLRAVALLVTVAVIAFGIVITASILGWIILKTLPKHARFPHDKAAKSFVVREIKGQLKRATDGSPSLGATQKPTPLADLERLREQGIISVEEYERKKKEIGL